MKPRDVGAYFYHDNCFVYCLSSIDSRLSILVFRKTAKTTQTIKRTMRTTRTMTTVFEVLSFYI